MAIHRLCTYTFLFLLLIISCDLTLSTQTGASSLSSSQPSSQTSSSPSSSISSSSPPPSTPSSQSSSPSSSSPKFNHSENNSNNNYINVNNEHTNDNHANTGSHSNLNSNNNNNNKDNDQTGSCEEYDYCNDPSGFEAIRRIHARLDDDADGDVDISESDGFLRDELQYENAGDRHRNFHGNDKHISVDELWRQWIISAVHNWSVDETCDWLSTSLELPEYIEIFQQKQINGTALPRMANPSYISSLGIKDLKHRQKISLKAMDVVLFGPPQRHNYYKDIILLLMCVIAIGGLWFALVQYKYSQTHLKKMMKDFDSLQRAELQLQDLQRELDEARHVQEVVSNEKLSLEEKLRNELNKISNSSNCRIDSNGIGDDTGGRSLSDMDANKINELEDELQKTRDRLNRAEEALSNKAWAPPHQLQLWLQYTYELELQHYNSKRQAAEQQLAAAKEGCEKLRKKRSSFLGSFRVAHGSSIDDVDNRIIQAKSALTEITANLKERLKRWQQIEQLCGFQVVQNPGFLAVHAELYPPFAPSSMSPSDPTNLTRNNSETAFHDNESDSFDLQKSMNLSRSALVYRPTRTSRCESVSTMSLPTTSRAQNQNGHSNMHEESHSEGDSNDEDRPLSMLTESVSSSSFSHHSQSPPQRKGGKSL
ncbi:stromal interaction molecule isoform X2 [Brevipalpus obovatus]|uniref:stromal interaction molecule isoform X2 n=1 Tax=Brevipalpus obovatus TaxID=246614 RepID=UPI003D9E32BB